MLDTGAPVIILNAEYLQVTEWVGRDTVRQLDTLRPGDAPTPGQARLTVHTLQLGTLQIALDTTNVGSPTLLPYNAKLASEASEHKAAPKGVTMLGILGLPAWESVETIIDYAHRRLILIRLDAAGRRLARVPRYTPVQRIPLLPVRMKGGAIEDALPEWWGIPARLGGVLDTVMLDTGSPLNNLMAMTADQMLPHVQDDSLQSWEGQRMKRVRVDTVVVAGRMFTDMPFADEAIDSDILGYEFFRRLDLFGFNFRTHTLLTYRSQSAGH